MTYQGKYVRKVRTNNSPDSKKRSKSHVRSMVYPPGGWVDAKSFVRKQKSPRARKIPQIETLRMYAVASSTRPRLILMPATGVGFAQQQQAAALILRYRVGYVRIIFACWAGGQRGFIISCKKGSEWMDGLDRLPNLFFMPRERQRKEGTKEGKTDEGGKHEPNHNNQTGHEPHRPHSSSSRKDIQQRYT